MVLAVEQFLMLVPFLLIRRKIKKPQIEFIDFSGSTCYANAIKTEIERRHLNMRIKDRFTPSKLNAGAAVGAGFFGVRRR
ncbi:hypothetical protein FEI15_13135 [Lacticaseibacillus zeae]|uniref:Uncharacterized protein n=1 Tax=Lacticaseibacillus zeae TaxID=57037 RepID=A0A5R8LJI6_LACZE|nr:hypothetical protein FEI15_13135 [Lacticaseibacillus zeae]